MTLINEYDVYHDESQVAGYWHGILFVPRKSRKRLLDYLAQGRERTDYKRSLSLKNIERTTGAMFRCTECWLHLGIAALIQNLKGGRYPILTGGRARSKEYDFLDQVIGARFILFRVRDGLGALSSRMDYGAKVETTFRMPFKGGLNLFSADGNTLCIRSLHFDGHLQYGRNLDKARIIGRLGHLPGGVVITEDLDLLDGSSDHDREDAQHYDDCQLLQLTDILVGGFRTLLGAETSAAQLELSRPLMQLVERWSAGPHRMKNSKWHRGFAISEGILRGDKWEFREIGSDVQKSQPGLFSE